MIYSYRMTHDYGLAPNPFGGHCTLAVCKPQLRNERAVSKGDWVIGTAGVGINRANPLIYAMQVEEIISMQEYWEDERFQYKRPKMDGSLVQMSGDNIYHHDPAIKQPTLNDWIQEESLHTVIQAKDHLKRDLGKGQNVLIATHFYYWGGKAIPIPEYLKEVESGGRGIKSTGISENIRTQFITWLTEHHRPGMHGNPSNWQIKHNIPSEISIFE